MYNISVIGAGQVGSAIAYTLALSGLADSLTIIDIDENRARGEALDIAHGMAMCPPISVSGGGYRLLDGADMVIMAAGASQKVGESRRELAGRNLKVMEAAAREIALRAPEAMLIVVSNPVDVLTRAAVELTGFPARRVIGSGTVLDTMRLRVMLAAHTRIDPRNIHGFVLGEHGDSEFAAWSTVTVCGMSMEEYCADCGMCDRQLPERMEAAFDAEVRRAAYRVISMKGATSHAIALAVRRIVQAVTGDERAILTVSSLLSGQYGVHDACLSLPCVVGRRGVERVIPVKLTPGEELSLRRCADAVRDGMVMHQPVH